MQRAIPVLVLATLFSVSGNSRASHHHLHHGSYGCGHEDQLRGEQRVGLPVAAGAPAITEIKGIFDMKIDGNSAHVEYHVHPVRQARRA